mmetsp:Transcript_10731/g.27105  ORF Transcript_10731/g.27105 Transcript_10731/m.27105 type:complete len:375 (-) Transcript_10731:2674-3798(-)
MVVIDDDGDSFVHVLPSDALPYFSAERAEPQETENTETAATAADGTPTTTTAAEDPTPADSDDGDPAEEVEEKAVESADEDEDEDGNEEDLPGDSWRCDETPEPEPAASDGRECNSVDKQAPKHQIQPYYYHTVSMSLVKLLALVLGNTVLACSITYCLMSSSSRSQIQLSGSRPTVDMLHGDSCASGIILSSPFDEDDLGGDAGAEGEPAAPCHCNCGQYTSYYPLGESQSDDDAGDGPKASAKKALAGEPVSQEGRKRNKKENKKNKKNKKREKVKEGESSTSAFDIIASTAGVAIQKLLAKCENVGKSGGNNDMSLFCEAVHRWEDDTNRLEHLVLTLDECQAESEFWFDKWVDKHQNRHRRERTNVFTAE